MKVTPGQFLQLGAFAPTVYGAVHNLFVGNLLPPASIYALEFNDETHAFKIIKNHTADASHAWITFDHAKTNIYATSLNESRIASYRVKNATEIELVKAIPASGACFNTTSAFITAMPTAPYYAFSGSWPGPNSCGMSFAADANGTLTSVADSWSYVNTSGVHGLALSPNDRKDGRQLLYSADLSGDLLWTHAINKKTGKVKPVDRFPMSASGMHPRHLVAHPNGQRLYTVMEGDNSVTQSELDPETGAVTKETIRHMLIPIDANTTEYWSAEVMLSPSSRYLWATARTRLNSTTGFVSAFLLSEDGQIVKKLFRVPTTTLGGIANAISPAPWSDEYAAMTDYRKGYVQMWKMEGGKEGREGVVEYSTANVVAQVDIGDGGCCANVIWYS
ncbi:Lactonase, 7-bladed beta-propeller-domain-containing protein [Chaetomidium leptoderma]|uniref:Lactonase, 7-bladed beta-propeller-domain-containing protein n=1 Tax=Chaetomidium leptoderma TaxID=669021 RepID=A0AAN6ZTX5_9PEZI|nr:Lactonase, 7-bladed beta-propeller-domain-containing protein [Chaetomidium leptoderma]